LQDSSSVFILHSDCILSDQGKYSSRTEGSIGNLLLGKFLNIYSRYLYASKLLAAAVFIMLNIIADAFAPSVESENNEFFRVIATGLTAISDKLLEDLHSFQSCVPK